MHTSVRLHSDKFSLRFFGMNAGRAGLLLAILLVGCTKQELPDLGPRLSQTAALELSPSLLESKAEYTDNCGHMQIVELGSTLQDMLFEAANRTFASVVRPGSNVKPDVVVRVKLVQSNFTLRMDGVYDRAETDLQLGGLVSFVDQAGTASQRLTGDAVGMTLPSANPADASRSRYSACVRSRPPGETSI